MRAMPSTGSQSPLCNTLLTERLPFGPRPEPRGQVGVQNLAATGCGAYTGEVAAAQVKDFGLEWAILGHSERRTKSGNYCEMVHH